jgi:hypothetical protein
MFELRRLFGPRKDEMTRGHGKLHNEEYHNFYGPHIIRMMTVMMSRACSTNGGGDKEECV